MPHIRPRTKAMKKRRQKMKLDRRLKAKGVNVMLSKKRYTP